MLVRGPPWQNGEPSGAMGEDCVHTRNADLYDELCDRPLGYFWECDAFADDPSRY